MQNDPPQAGTVFIPSQQAPTGPGPTCQPGPQFSEQVQTDRRQVVYEYIMLGFGLLTIVSLLLSIGPLLKLSVGVFLIVAIISIVRVFTGGGVQKMQGRYVADGSQPQYARPQYGVVYEDPSLKKKKKLLKIVGISLVSIALLPVLAYGSFFVLIVVVMMLSGGQGGT